MSELPELAGNLGLSDKQLLKLHKKHGDALESVLAKWWSELREKPRFMARQGGNRPRTRDGQYVETSALAIDDAEVVPAGYQRVITMESHGRWASYESTERAQEVAERQGKQLVRKLRKLQADAARSGVDITPRLVAMIQAAEAEIAESRKAA